MSQQDEHLPIPGLPKQQEWTVLAVREGKEESNPQGGMLKKFYVDFEGMGDVYWRRKMPATVEVGRSYFGTISNGTYGPIFKKETPDAGGFGSEASSTGKSKGRSFKPESQFDPEKVARMGRAHAQDMALQLLALQERKQATLTEVLAIADEFEADVDAAGARASAADNATVTPGGNTMQGGPEKAPSQPAVPTDETTMRNLGEHAGLDNSAALELAQFVCKRLNPEQQVRAKQGLESDTSSTLEQLKSAFETAEGRPLQLEADPTIPF